MTPREEFAGLREYERHVGEVVNGWDTVRRVVFVAAMAERWLPAYAEFTAVKRWGRVDVLRGALDTVWAHLAGTPLDERAAVDQAQRVQEQTPHLDDFDAPAALSAAVIVHDALSACARPEQSTHWAWDAALSGLAAVAPELVEDESAPRGRWRRADVRRELRAQLRLLSTIGAVAGVGRHDLDGIRALAASPEMLGAVPPPSETREAPGRSNRELFDQYRAIMERQLRNPQVALHIPGGTLDTFIGIVLGRWGARYSRRRAFIDGSYGRPADATAMRALIDRQRAHEAAEPAAAEWSDDVRKWIGYFFNPHNGLDVQSADDAPAYGPSVRRLWLEARARGESEIDAWESVAAWGTHRPAAWDAEDRRKKQRRSPTERALAASLERAIDWLPTGDADQPWVATVDGVQWNVQLNDFPDAVMYTLLLGNSVVGDFHDWPDAWQRPRS